jgi:hypothetical protein
MAWAVACAAQSAPAASPLPKTSGGPAPCSVTPQPVPCGTTPAATGKPSTAEQFPFPEEGSGGGSGASLTPYGAPAKPSEVPQAPDAPGATPAAASGAASAAKTAAQFPFPEEENKSAASGSAEARAADNSSSSSSSSSISGDDAADPDAKADGSTDAAGLKDKGSEGTQSRHLLHRVDPVTKPQTPDEREAEDLSVAKFYTDTGNLQGAYLRSQDAVKTTPDDPNAHFALAEAALKLDKRDEAIAEYNACLKLDPVDKMAKQARKALERLKQ